MPTISDSRQTTSDVINEYELISIKSLLAYTAYDKKTPEPVVRDIFSNHFGIEAIEKLSRDNYDHAIRFLVDFQIQMIH